MNKDDEQVLVVPNIHRYDGFIPVDGVRNFDIVIRQASSFMRRGDVENDPSFQQIIPYTIIYCEDKVLLYKRGIDSGEERLTHLYSIGIGGHVNITDDTCNLNIPLTIFTALERELNEELGIVIDEDILSLYPSGFICSDKDEVSSVHLGIVFKAVISKEVYDKILNEKGVIENISLVSPHELDEYNLEDWSEIIVPHSQTGAFMDIK